MDICAKTDDGGSILGLLFRAMQGRLLSPNHRHEKRNMRQKPARVTPESSFSSLFASTHATWRKTVAALLEDTTKRGDFVFFARLDVNASIKAGLVRARSLENIFYFHIFFFFLFFFPRSARNHGRCVCSLYARVRATRN